MYDCALDAGSHILQTKTYGVVPIEKQFLLLIVIPVVLHVHEPNRSIRAGEDGSAYLVHARAAHRAASVHGKEGRGRIQNAGGATHAIDFRWEIGRVQHKMLQRTHAPNPLFGADALTRRRCEHGRVGRGVASIP